MFGYYQVVSVSPISLPYSGTGHALNFGMDDALKFFEKFFFFHEYQNTYTFFSFTS